MKRYALLSLLTFVLLLPGIASAQDAQLPWFVMTVRPTLGAGGGAITYSWDTFGGVADVEETVQIKSIGYFSVIPEAYFMPTKGRGFIISASLPISTGQGKFGTSDSDNNRLEDVELRQFSYFAVLGLGYQWYFGERKATNLMLLPHLGIGRYSYTVDYQGETYDSDPLGAGTFDITVGSTHRFDSNFVIGGSLDLDYIGFSGDLGGNDLFDAKVNGRNNLMRLSLILGYAFK